MGLPKAISGSRLKELNDNGVRVRVVGDASAFEPRIQTLLRKTEQEHVATKDCSLLLP